MRLFFEDEREGLVNMIGSVEGPYPVDTRLFVIPEGRLGFFTDRRETWSVHLRSNLFCKLV